MLECSPLWINNKAQKESHLFFLDYSLCHSLLHVQVDSPVQETSILSKHCLGHRSHGAVTPDIY